MKKSIYLFFILFSCSEPMDLVVFKEQILEGTPCIGSTNYDVLNGLPFVNSNDFNNKSYGCLFVTKDKDYPVFDGNESARFEVRTNDCGWNSTWSDCKTDVNGFNRSRSEIREDWTNPTLFYNKILSYKVRIYIPSSQLNFKPTKDGLLVLNQVHYNNQGKTGALCYLVVGNDDVLLIRTHRDFTWIGLNDYEITRNAYNRWITLKYVVKVTDKSDGYIEVYVDDKFLFRETRPTIESTKTAINLKIGIYNTFTLSRPQQYNQVVFMDGIEKTIE